MGRPPLKIKKVTLRLFEGMDERIDALAGHNQRSEWVRDRLLRLLEEEEQAAKKGEVQLLKAEPGAGPRHVPKPKA